MSVYMINKGWEDSSGSINDQIEYEIYNERIGHAEMTLAGSITLAARNIGDFFWLCGCCDSDGGNPALVGVKVTGNNPATFVRPSRDLVRVLAAWGTQVDSDALMHQVFNNGIAVYHGDFSFIPDFGEPGGGFSTGGVFLGKAINGAYPRGLCAAVYTRMEARREADLQTIGGVGFGFAQCNSGGVHVIEGQAGQSMTFISLTKALTRASQQEAAEDWCRQVIDPDGNTWWSLVNDHTRAMILFSGFEMKANTNIPA